MYKWEKIHFCITLQLQLFSEKEHTHLNYTNSFNILTCQINRFLMFRSLNLKIALLLQGIEIVFFSRLPILILIAENNSSIRIFITAFECCNFVSTDSHYLLSSNFTYPSYFIAEVWYILYWTANVRVFAIEYDKSLRFRCLLMYGFRFDKTTAQTTCRLCSESHL